MVNQSQTSNSQMNPLRYRILITGGAGFIGTHLGRICQNLGHSVTSLDLVPPAPERRSDEVDFVQGDVRDEAQIQWALDQNYDAIFFLAAISSVPHCDAEPHLAYETNTLAPLRWLERLRNHSRDTRFIFSSTSAVYGHSGSEHQALSEASPLQPLSHYAYQKWITETALTQAAIHAKLPYYCFRLFNVYGPYQDPKSPYSGVISKFIDLATQKKPLILFGDGHQTRDFVHVQDVVKGLLSVLKLKTPLQHPINLGSGSSISIKQLATLIQDLCEVPHEQENHAERPNDVRHSVSSIEFLKKTLGITPEVRLEQGLKELIQSSRNAL